jgi:hypothetical protein
MIEEQESISVTGAILGDWIDGDIPPPDHSYSKEEIEYLMRQAQEKKKIEEEQRQIRIPPKLYEILQNRMKRQANDQKKKKNGKKK